MDKRLDGKIAAILTVIEKEGKQNTLEVTTKGNMPVLAPETMVLDQQGVMRFVGQSNQEYMEWDGMTSAELEIVTDALAEAGYLDAEGRPFDLGKLNEHFVHEALVLFGERTVLFDMLHELQYKSMRLFEDAAKLFMEKYQTDTVYFYEDDRPLVVYKGSEFDDTVECYVNSIEFSKLGSIRHITLDAYRPAETFTASIDDLEDANYDDLLTIILGYITSDTYCLQEAKESVEEDFELEEVDMDED